MLKCCYPTCPRDADFIIIDRGDNDPYTCETHSCERCLGAMIGHSMSGILNGKDEWIVIPVEEEND